MLDESLFGVKVKTARVKISVGRYHSPPSAAADAVEIPIVIKKHLGLDDERSWIVVTELNLFSWPGPDLRPTGAAGLDTVLYGYLPSGFFRLVRDRLTANIRANRMKQCSEPNSSRVPAIRMHADARTSLVVVGSREGLYPTYNLRFV